MLVLFLTSTNSFPLSSKALDLKISSSISETYDDNLTFAKDDKKEDFITTLGLGDMNEKKRAINCMFDQ